MGGVFGFFITLTFLRCESSELCLGFIFGKTSVLVYKEMSDVVLAQLGRGVTFELRSNFLCTHKSHTANFQKSVRAHYFFFFLGGEEVLVWQGLLSSGK